MSSQRETTWFLQACEDLLWAKSSHRSGHFAQVCFIAQQIGEKALKALAFGRDAVEVRGHSITKLAAALKINDEVERCARALDAYYISARYPDAYPEGLPSEYLKA